MTDETTTDAGTVDETEQPTQAATTNAPSDEPPEQQDTEPKSHEAKKYRQRAQAAETERDALQAVVQSQRDALLSEYVDVRLVAAAGLDTTDALNEDGVFDRAKAAELAAQVHEALGTRQAKPKKTVSQLQSGTQRGPGVPAQPSFADAFRRQER